MPKKHRIAVLGLTHDHVWGNLEDLHRIESAQLAGAADPHPPLLDKMQKQFGCPVYSSCEELLAKEKSDAAFIFSDNATGVALCELAAAHGLDILIEKPLAHNLDGANRILAAVRNNDVRLMVNWPFAWWPQLQHALNLAASGDIGDIWQVKYRAAHAGPKELGCSEYFCGWLFDRERNGGGALIDYCCYGVVLARSLLGMPAQVTAVAGRLCKDDISVEDNAVVVMSYPRAIALAEASWTQIDKLTSYITVIYGTKGTLLVEPRLGGRLVKATREKPDGAEVTVPAPPPELQNAARHFFDCIAIDRPFLPMCQDKVCRDVQEILETALLSAAES